MDYFTISGMALVGQKRKQAAIQIFLRSVPDLNRRTMWPILQIARDSYSAGPSKIAHGASAARIRCSAMWSRSAFRRSPDAPRTTSAPTWWITLSWPIQTPAGITSSVTMDWPQSGAALRVDISTAKRVTAKSGCRRTAPGMRKFIQIPHRPRTLIYVTDTTRWIGWASRESRTWRPATATTPALPSSIRGSGAAAQLTRTLCGGPKGVPLRRKIVAPTTDAETIKGPLWPP